MMDKQTRSYLRGLGLLIVALSCIIVALAVAHII